MPKVERGLKRLRTEQLGRSLEGPIEVVALEPRHGRPGIAAKTLSMPEQSCRVLGALSVDGDDAQLRATHRSTGEQVCARIDAVRQPARLTGEVQLERFGRRLGRRGVATVEPVQHGPTGEGEEHDRRVAQSAGNVQRSVVGNLCTCLIAVLEQGPAQPGEQ